LATISYDSVEIVAAFAREHSITYPMLSDAGSAVIKKFGILNPVAEWALGPEKDDPTVQAEVQKYVSVVRPNAGMVGMAFPGTFILDTQGRVKQRFFEDLYFERNTVSNLLIKLGNKSDAVVTGTLISTAHLEIATYPSIAQIAPGDRFSVALEIEPHSKIHVYAPGAEIYFFKPLNERVPVFQKPFRLVQELVLEGTRPAQEALRGKEIVTVNGTLEYQACNDKECFNPVSVPLSWTMNLRPLITQRPGPQKQ
jgi:peroxiredoxin